MKLGDMVTALVMAREAEERGPGPPGGG